MTTILAITQARTGSTRLPGKVLMKIGEKSLLEIHLQRVLRSKKITNLVVATTIETNDIEIVSIAKKMKLHSFRGSVEDVLDRFYKVALPYQPTWVVRITSDCPLIDPELIDEVIDFAISRDLDYCSNTLIENYPDGQDIEVMKFTSLEIAWFNATKSYQREHVTPFIIENSTFRGGEMFVSDNFPAKENFGDVRLTVDQEADYILIKQIITNIGFEKSWLDYANYYRINPALRSLNENLIRNEGFRIQ